MAGRLELQTRFETILGSRNVYFQPPESIKMRYPAIRYELSKINVVHADDMAYKKERCYEATLIDDDPDTEVVDAIMSIPMCHLTRTYMSDNLYHFVFELYF